MRKLHQWFCDSVVVRSREHGRINDDVLAQAALDCFMNLERKDDEAEYKAALRKANRLMRRPDIKDRIAQMFANRGFTIVDAVDALVQHIRGTPIVRRGKNGEPILDSNGNEEIVYTDPSLAALRDYFRMVLPHEQKMKLTLEATTPEVNPAHGIPPMLPRVIDSSIER